MSASGQARALGLAFVAGLLIGALGIVHLAHFTWGGRCVQLISSQDWSPSRSGQQVSTTAGNAAAALQYPIWWAAPFVGGSGYGSEAISYTFTLLQDGLIRPQDLWLTQSAGATDHAPKQEPHIEAFLRDQDYKQLSKKLAPEDLQRQVIVVCHSFPDGWRRPGDKEYANLPGIPCPTDEMMKRQVYTIGRTMFETDRLPEHLVQHAQHFDEIWVPSQFNVDTFAASGLDPQKLHVLPESINTSLFDPAAHHPTYIHQYKNTMLAIGRESNKPAGTPFVFLSVFKWELRKGWDVMLNAFLHEFKPEDNVELHIVTHPFMEKVDDWGHHIREAVDSRCGFKPSDDKRLLPLVYVTSEYIPDDNFCGLYKGADALVIPTRGEGWGRPQMEAMAMGLPVISTNWSGTTAFLNEQTGYPIAVEALVEAESDGPSFFSYFKGSKWAQPSLTHTRQLMRHVVTHREEAKAKGQAARRYLQEHLGPNQVAKTLQGLILQAEKRAAAKAANAAATPH